MFNLAAVVYVAKVTGRQPAMLRFKPELELDTVFDHGMDRFDDLCPCYVYSEDKSNSLRFDHRLAEPDGSLVTDARGKTILLSGYCSFINNYQDKTAELSQRRPRDAPNI